MTALRLITDADWERMPWSARQRWLATANGLRRQILAELDALARDERSRLIHFAALSDSIARRDKALAEADAELGPGRLNALGRASAPQPAKRPSTPEQRERDRDRKRRAYRAQRAAS